MLSRSALVALACVLVPAVDALAQRRGRSEAIQERVSSYFVEAKLPAAVESEKDRLAGLAIVKEAKEQQHLVFAYLYDSSVEEPKREGFDKVIFGSDEVGLALRCFRCVHVDIAGDTEAQTKFGRKLPLFYAYDEKGKQVGEASLAGYKAAIGPVMTLLEKAAAGYVKPMLASWVKDYREVVRELENLDGKRKVLEGRRARADDKKKVLLTAEAKELDIEEVRLLTAEKELLASVKLPERDATAKRLVVEQRGR